MWSRRQADWGGGEQRSGLAGSARKRQRLGQDEGCLEIGGGAEGEALFAVVAFAGGDFEGKKRSSATADGV